MQAIASERADELLWLGRYMERVHTTVAEYFVGYDRMIDESLDSHADYCRAMSIPDVYPDKAAFLRDYPFDESNPDSILSNLIRAYDNAVVLRDEIGTETLSYVQLAVYEMRKASVSRAPMIQMLSAMDYIYAFWGCLDDAVQWDEVRSIVKTGRRLERLDLYIRFGRSADELRTECTRLARRIARTPLRYDPADIVRIEGCLSSDPVDRAGAIRLLESLIRG